MTEATRLEPIPRSFLGDAPAASMNVGLALISRRSTAIADFWRCCADVRLPTELMALQLNYWSQMVGDYQEALNEGFAQLSADTEADAGAAAAQPDVRSA